MQHKAFSHWFYHYQQQALRLNERRLVVLVGDDDWASSLLQFIGCDSVNVTKQNKHIGLIYGESEHIKANVAKQRFRDKLGSESDFVIFNGIGSGRAELSIDAFAALSGTLVAGGVFFLLLKDMSQIAESLFYQRFFNLLNSFSEHVVIEQTAKQASLSLPELAQATVDNSTGNAHQALAYGCVTQEQVTAVAAIINVLKGKRNKPLVLTADRGRGKSSALAIACGQLLKNATKAHKLRLVITAGDIDALSVFFSQLAISLPEGELQHDKFSVTFGSVEFIPIDQLLKQKIEASLVLVDEAAAIPIYMLARLLSRYSRLVFSSTIHGYEGAGRGFTLKFQQTLTDKFPQWRSLHLHEPIRWRAEDPLERLVFDACLLNADLPKITAAEQKILPSTLSFKQYSATELAANEPLFKQLVAVLVTAHYQTKPSDVQMLLDNKHVQLVCLLSETVTEPQVFAVALLIHEGQSSDNHVNATDISAVEQSKRRLKNHFVPQSLLTQCGIDYAFDFHYLRIMRIAVHPELQQQGIGAYFLNKITEFSTVQGADFLAASFGATKALLSFWLNSEFKLARIGFSKDKASGEQSALVLKALSQVGEKAIADINAEFYRSFDYLLTDEYKYLAAKMVAIILHHGLPQQLAPLTVRDQRNVEAFAKGHRQYSSCVFSLHLWLKHLLVTSTSLKNEKLAVLVSRIMQKHGIDDICTAYGFTGKKDLEQCLRATIRACIGS